MMNRIDNSGEGIARLGRDEDNYLAHVAQGEMVVPPVITPETRQRLEQDMMNMGLDPAEYTVGEGMSINPITGMPEFGWLKKTFKSIKKVAKKVAPVVGPLANFIPGVGPLMSAAIGAGTTKLAGGSWKDALKAGAFSYGAGKLGGGIGGLKGKPTGGNFFGNAKEFLFKGKDGVGLFGNLGKGITGLKDKAGEFIFKGDDGVGLFGNLFGGGATGGPQFEPILDASGNPTGMYQEVGIPGSSFSIKQLQDAGIMDASGNFAGSPLSNLSQGKSGGLGSLFGGTPGQSKIGLIEDFLKGKSSDPVRDGGGLFGGMLGGNMGAAGIAALLGKTVYDAAKERQGGLAATPAVTMDALGRYSLANALGTGGTREEFGLGPAPSSLKFNMGGPVNRQYFNQGGAAIKELDMRDGGESAGPGTGTSDDIPAMLSDGEFVMTAKATRGAGAFGMNKTKSGIELVKGGKASREKGVENMRELMNIFEAI